MIILDIKRSLGGKNLDPLPAVVYKQQFRQKGYKIPVSPQRFVAVRTVNRSKRTVSPHTVIRSQELSSRESGFSFKG